MNYFFQRIIKRQARVYFFLFLLLVFLSESSQQCYLFGNSINNSVPRLDSNRSVDVYRTKNAGNDYKSSISKLVAAAESKGGIRLDPKIIKKICLKIESELAPGLCISKRFIDGILDFLIGRGYGRDSVYLVDRDFSGFMSIGLVSRNSNMKLYRGFRIISSLDSNYYSSSWFHDSSMPPVLHDRIKLFNNFPENLSKRLEEERKSYLPSVLFLNDYFWLNIAVLKDHVNLGVDAASANVTTGAISNHKRFLKNQTLATAAVTEILAIPEFWAKRTYSIIDLSKYQYANGGQFDASFLGSEDTILLSDNPVSLDFYGLKVLSRARGQSGFSQRDPNKLLLFKYAKELGLGDPYKAKIFDIK